MYSVLRYIALSLMLVMCFRYARAQSGLDACDITWHRQSRHSGESMPCGGGDIGMNVWMENGELLCYISRSGAFDENNIQLKQGRLRVKLTPDPFGPGTQFTQTLHLRQGYIEITGRRGAQLTRIRVWVEVKRPLIHVEVNSRKPVKVTASYENWRTQDRLLHGAEQQASSGYRGGPVPVIIYHDSVGFDRNKIVFSHRNRDDRLLFDFTVQQQGLNQVKGQLWNPQRGLSFGGLMWGNDMRAARMRRGKYINTEYTGWDLQSEQATRYQHIRMLLHTDQTPNYETWYEGLLRAGDISSTDSQAPAGAIRAHQAQDLRKGQQQTDSIAFLQTQAWWQAYWDRSYIFIQGHPASKEWQAGRNYQLFRYMLGCNAYGAYPTKFNGGLFTYDPVFVKAGYPFTPDHRNWGGGTFTAQNQRLVYWPLLKSGDFDMMLPQFAFYLRALQNATARTRFYWQHGGACFTEQMENFGLPAASEYGWNRPASFDAGVEYNNWLEYEWDTVLEFCLMILDWERYSGQDIHPYLPMIESCLGFFDEHYQYLAKQRGQAPLDSNGHLILYPGSAGETYKLTYNSATTIAGLYTVTSRMLDLPVAYLTQEQRMRLQGLLQRIPPLPQRRINGYTMLSPAQSWQRINNQETPQLYPVFPYGIYGIGKPGLTIARNTWLHDTDAIARRSPVGWKQDNIFCARLGLTREAAYYTLEKLKNGPNRFPAFWGPGFDWTPDLNQGGSGMIGLQEMLMQTDGRKIYLFPAWPVTWDVRFKLHAPYETTVSGRLKGGRLVELKVEPEERKRDVVVMEVKGNF